MTWDTIHQRATQWLQQVRDRHEELLRRDPAYARDLTTGISAAIKAIGAHPAIHGAVLALTTHWLGNSRALRPKNSWDRDWDDDRDWDE